MKKYTHTMDIQNSFDDSLQNTALPDAMADITESGIDALLNNEVLKEIPIVKVFLGITQAGCQPPPFCNTLSFLCGGSRMSLAA